MSERSRISRFTTTALAGLSLAALTACSTGLAAATELSQKPSDKTDTATQIQYELADCMKQQGFEYIPAIRPPAPAVLTDMASGDLAAMKRFREKYGFGAFFRSVYPKDEVSKYLDGDWDDPNNKLKANLSGIQAERYFTSLETCFRQAVKKVLNKDVKSEDDLIEQYDKANSSAGAKLEVEFAGSVKPRQDCLRKKGYHVDWGEPSVGASDELTEFWKEYWRLNSGKPLSADQARPYLEREIKIALDDLECGKDYYPAYRSKLEETARRLGTEFGQFLMYSPYP